MNFISATTTSPSLQSNTAQVVADANGLITATLGTLNYGESALVNITARSTYAGTLYGATNVTSDEYDTDVTDNFLVSSQVINFVPSGINHPPIAQANKNFSIAEDAAPTQLNIAAPTDVDGDTLEIGVTTLPDPIKGKVQLANGTDLTANQTLTISDLTGLIFLPASNANGGGGAFSYSVNDGKGGTSSQTVTLDITPVNDAPILNNPLANQSIITGNSLNFALAANTFSDPDAGDILSYSVKLANGNPLPTWLNFNPTTQTFTGTPAIGDVGNLSITVTATDQAGLTASSNFALNVTTVAPINNPPVLSNAIADQNTSEDSAFNFIIPVNTFTDVDAGDVLTYSATLENGNALPSWLTFNATEQSFSGTPTNNEVGSLNLKITTKDSSGAIANDTFALTVANTNDAPILRNGIADQNTSEDSAFNFTFDANTFTDIDAGDSLTYSATLSDGSSLPSWISFNSVTRTFSGTPSKSNVGNLTIGIKATDKSGVSTTDTFLLTVEPTTFKLSKIADDVFSIFNSSGKSKLQVSLTERRSQLVNEIGVFKIDDALGNINGIAPNATGYTQAALDRSKVIFSAISNNPTGFDPTNLSSLLEFNSSDNLRFYLVRNSSTDAVKSTNSFSDILFSSTLNTKITDLGSDQFSLAWKDTTVTSSDFKDLVVKAQSVNDSLPLGTNLQGNFQGEVIDLRDITRQVKADFTVNREAAFNNYIGFYKVADEFGGIDTNGDGKADLLTGQTGYTEAAVLNRVAGIDLTVSNQGTATYSGIFQPGSIFAPFMIVNSQPAALLDSNPANDPAVYFPYLGANSDKSDHIRLLGNNTFGFEDLTSLGDKDFNDMIVKVNLSII